ncbi:MAG TPA: hypothetical protein VM686_37255 [Polyangiaceae bacterium]|jgi:hypothetical protein|nr:hypothetical protein [Polyangiaceae bacterium]
MHRWTLQGITALFLSLGAGGCGATKSDPDLAPSAGGEGGSSTTPERGGSGGSDAAGSDAGSGATDGGGDGGSPPMPADSDPEVMRMLDNVDNLSEPLLVGFSRIGQISWAHGPADETLEAGQATVEEVQGKGRAWHVVQAQGEASDLLWDITSSIGGAPPDLSAYAGIAFAIRSTGASANLTVAFTDRTIAQDGSGTYVQDTEGGMPWFTTAVTATPEWRRVAVLFDDFSTAQDRLFSASDFRAMHFVSGDDGQAGDYWIDDIALLCRGECPVLDEDTIPSSPYDFPPLITEDTLDWFAGAGPSAGCAEGTLLNDFPRDGFSGQAERLVVRVRPTAGNTAPEAWAWTVTTGTEDVSVLPLAEDGSTVAFPASAGGLYAVTATAPDCPFLFDAMAN